METSLTLNTLLSYFWPITMVAQVVASFYAAKKCSGSGPVLMIVGSLISTACFLYFTYFATSDDLPYESIEISFAIRQSITFIARSLFLVGLLLVVLGGRKVRRNEMDVLDSF